MAIPASSRNALLARLHCIKKEQGWDDDTYRDVLFVRTQAMGGTGYRSSKDIPGPLLARLVAALGGQKTAERKPHEWSWVDTAPDRRRDMLRKIIMQCKNLGIKRGGQVAYVEGIAKQMAGLMPTKISNNIAKPLAMCDEGDLWQIVAALEYQVKRVKAEARAKGVAKS